MTKSSKKVLATKAKYNAQPAVKKKRAATNKARREAEAKGLVKKGDGRHVDHKKPLDKGGSTNASNTRVVSAAKNKGWRADHPEMYTKNKKA